MARRRARSWMPWIALVVACGSSNSTPPTPSPTKTAAVESPPSAPATTTTVAAPPVAAPTPAPATTLASLLPAATPPITLQHARELARGGSWLAAAAVYGAMFESDPTDVRALSGRGFSLASSGDPRADALARADFERALTLTASPATKAMVHFNFGALEERLGHRDAARGHYAEAVALSPSDAAKQALARTGGPAVAAKPSAAVCEMTTPAQAERAASALDVVRKIRAAQDSSVDLPADENAARETLCDGPCEPAFVSTLGDGGSTVEAHVVVHERGGFWLVPRLARGNGTDARCPDEITDVSVEHRGPLVRASFSMLVNYWDDCDMDDPQCLNGCFWSARIDHVVLVDEAKGRHVVVTGRSPEIEIGGGGPWEELENTPVLPAGMIETDGATVKVRGCGLTEDVTL